MRARFGLVVFALLLALAGAWWIGTTGEPTALIEAPPAPLAASPERRVDPKRSPPGPMQSAPVRAPTPPPAAAIARELDGVVVRCDALPVGAEVLPDLPLERLGRFPGSVSPVVESGATLFVAPPGPGTARWTLRGVAEGDLTWPAGSDVVACVAGQRAELTGIHGVVVGAGGEPRPDARVHGCGGWADPDDDGTFFLFGPEGSCSLAATVRDGEQDRAGPAVQIEVEAGIDVAGVVLHAPPVAKEPARSTEAERRVNCLGHAGTWAFLTAAGRAAQPPVDVGPFPGGNDECRGWAAEASR